ncbi:ParA family protein [Agromyces sp. NPDC058126]|uniref:ParA family protein n=1 Tax=Agromyces sp. NPDC058126 TaxID=3346350 RepID=UPI0036DCBB84
MDVVAVYSESGGVAKTTGAVSVAVCAARDGLRTVLIDLDPRGAATKWLDVEPVGDGLHVGAILGAEDSEGWAEQLAVPTTFSENLRAIPSARAVSNREADRSDHIEVRLKASLEGLDADLVVIDCPNRQGGPLTLSALTAADKIVYAAKASGDGVDGVAGARVSVAQFKRNRERIGAPAQLEESGIIVTRDRQGFLSIPEVEAINRLREEGPQLGDLVQQLAIVAEVRMAGAWYGDYRKGASILSAYKKITGEILGRDIK